MENESCKKKVERINSSVSDYGGCYSECNYASTSIKMNSEFLILNKLIVEELDDIMLGKEEKKSRLRLHKCDYTIS